MKKAKIDLVLCWPIKFAEAHPMSHSESQSLPEESFSTLTWLTSGDVGGRDLQGDGRRFPSRGSEPFVLILGGCRVELGDPDVVGLDFQWSFTLFNYGQH